MTYKLLQFSLLIIHIIQNYQCTVLRNVDVPSKTELEPRIKCNSIKDKSILRESLENATHTISNWSVAEEVKRLITINSIVPIEPEYNFHKEYCPHGDKNPFDNKELFYNRDKSGSKSVKYQCKECKKITNVLPGQE